MLDLFCGRLGWSKAFLARGWECVGVDLIESPISWDDAVKFKYDCKFGFIKADVMDFDASIDGKFWYGNYNTIGPFDFICASSPCEEFSKWGMRRFFPDPPYPAIGVRLFNHTRELCETSGKPYIMENVRAAQQFVGPARGHCGPFHLWGSAVPPLVPQGIIKGMTRKALGHYDYEGEPGWNTKNERAERRQNEDKAASLAATIPPELANCVAAYAERLLEQKCEAVGSE